MKRHPSEHIKSHCFRAKKYKIYWHRKLPYSAGSCDHPTTPNKHFAVDLTADENNTPEKLLQCVIEEGIHAAFPDIEDCVAVSASTDIASFCRRMGFEWTFDKRKPKKKK